MGAWEVMWNSIGMLRSHKREEAVTETSILLIFAGLKKKRERGNREEETEQHPQICWS